MNKIRDGTKWFSTTTYVDVETGETISKSDYERGNYRKIKTTKSYEFTEKSNRKYGEIKHTIEIKEHEQTRLCL